MKLPQKERIAYKRVLENLSLEKSVMETARFDGFKDGEKQKAIEIAKKSLLKGLDIKIVADLTDLTIDEIREIAKR